MSSWRRILVNLPEQRLVLFDGEAQLAEYPVSTGAAGAGEREGSGATPRGHHYLRALIGAGLPVGTVFRGRRPTGEVYSEALGRENPGRDWILSRILWLCGLEPGFNRLGDRDTFRRYIYLHGTPDSEPMGVPRSHGCVRLRNADIVDLFERVGPGTRVFIQD
ncbi:MAG: L,D-transpeptidase family protein [Pseudomonadota bacterium]